MSDFSVAGDTPAHKYAAEASDDTTTTSITPQISMKSWHIDMLIVVVGLPTLIFFVAMGGVFALLGPWVIYTGVLSIRKRPGLGRQILRIITGAALLCLSAAVLLAPVHTGPWCFAGGILGLLAGASYLTATLFTMRKTNNAVA
jgi:hypothetical protein